MTETEEAVRRFLNGEEEAFSRIVRHWERKIYNLAWRMVGNREDAQDIVQETFLSVFKSIRGLRDPGSFSTWLYQITLNHCRARRRSRSFDLSLNDPGSDESRKRKTISYPGFLRRTAGTRWRRSTSFKRLWQVSARITGPPSC